MGTLLCSLRSTSARNCSWSASTPSTSRSAVREEWRQRHQDPVHSRPSGLLPETGSRLAGLRMSLLFPPIQPERATVAEVEDCEKGSEGVHAAKHCTSARNRCCYRQQPGGKWKHRRGQGSRVSSHAPSQPARSPTRLQAVSQFAQSL